GGARGRRERRRVPAEREAEPVFDAPLRGPAPAPHAQRLSLDRALEDAVRVDRAPGREPRDRAECRLAPAVRDGGPRRDHHRPVRRRLGRPAVDACASLARERRAVVARRAVRREYRGRHLSWRSIRRGARRDPAHRRAPLARSARPSGSAPRRSGDEPNPHRAKIWLPRQPAPDLRPRLRERSPGARRARAARQHRRAARNSDGPHRRQDACARSRRARHEGNAMNRVLALAVVATLGILVGLAGCFKPPEIVMVDRATALEQQAAGSFDELERQLDRAAIEPRPVALTPEQLEALGIRPAPLVDESDLTDADRLDGLLAQHCVGEGKDGLIVDTRDACKGAADADEVQTLLERVNRARRQLWRWMDEQRANVSEGVLQRTWRENHVRNVVCGGWIEGSDGKWLAKSC